MNISIFGLGYVGCVGIGCFSESGHKVVGVDIDPKKVNLINQKKSTIVERGIDDLIKKGVEKGLISATQNVDSAVNSSDIAIICVGTPNDHFGKLDMNAIYNISKSIGRALKIKNSFFTIMIRSTVMPGTCNRVMEIIEKESKKKNNVDFAVILNPEFLREGSAIKDFYNPPYTVIGGSSEKAINIIKILFSFVSAPFYEVDIQVAELIKFLNNSYHALKVSFSNEIGRICKKLNIDSRTLMELFINDRILNISPKYFQPGFSYGGSCLPKDLRALNAIAHDQYLSVPVLEAIDKSNNEHNDFVYDIIRGCEKKNVGIYGLAFKAGTDDLRFSPSLALCERLIGKGYKLKIYDENVSLSKLMGKNKQHLLNHLPHISSLLCSNIESFISNSELIVFVHDNKNILEWKDKLEDEVIVVDIPGIEELKQKKNYIGIAD